MRCYRLHRLSYFPSREEDLIPISGDLARELKTILSARGYSNLSEGGLWLADDIAALKRFMGMENYDNRLRDDAMID
ncbi:putative peptidoglycan binding domain-containing protein [Breoghania sp.]|uniref:putative peptidoglycan binding domain-containing protein n=1 Tax=Breoghania sp. TaxID=2065378 RepID=UPI002626B3B0|nr:putative peptidoglycan binding domain-containing protein [Breoghania sp.]MDJ0932049.1 putative peptidoglycan binding domain-containing protein [Breoghania sp.]